MNPLPRWLYGHRGAPTEQPENTLPSFRVALDAGANALETDVHMTADGHLVVSHDPSGARSAGVRAEIRRTTLAELGRWDVGWGFVAPDGTRPFAQRGIRIPTLEQVLVEFPSVPLNVDAKQTDPSIVAPLLAVIRRLRAQGHVRLASFSSSTLRAIRRAGYEGGTGLGQSEVTRLRLLPRRLLDAWPVAGDAAQVPLAVGPWAFDSSAFLERCHARGIRVDYWTVDRPAEAARLLALGADGIMTDNPRAIAPTFRAHVV